MKKKCFVCDKKISIVYQFKCKCSNEHVFCNKHRNDHNCNFDYKQIHKDFISKNNPNITFTKLQKI